MMEGLVGRDGGRGGGEPLSRFTHKTPLLCVKRDKGHMNINSGHIPLHLHLHQITITMSDPRSRNCLLMLEALRLSLSTLVCLPPSYSGRQYCSCQHFFQSACLDSSQSYLAIEVASTVPAEFSCVHVARAIGNARCLLPLSNSFSHRII